MAPLRIAFVVQRYGLEVNGGAELHCRMLAGRLARRSEVSRVGVFTSCAKNYETWSNHYPPGAEIIDGVHVERFAALSTRAALWQGALAPWVMRLPHPSGAEWLWLLAQGPLVPGLLRRLRAVADDYDAFVFFTYLYFPTVAGIHMVPRHKRVLVPTAHDEPPIRQRMYRRVFRAPRAIAFNTEEERELVRERFGLDGVAHRIVGCGVDLAERASGPPREKPYLLYIGRLDANKGVSALAEAFVAFKERHGDALLERGDGSRYPARDLELVVAGTGDLALPVRDDILRIGFVGEGRKRALLEGCEALAMPSRYESLSLAMLEAWTLGRPVLVDAECEVARGHVARCNGGVVCRGRDGWASGIAHLCADGVGRAAMGAAGRSYARERYDWARIENEMLALVAGGRPVS